MQARGSVDTVRAAVLGFAQEQGWGVEPSDGPDALAFRMSASLFSWGQRITVTLTPAGEHTAVAVRTKVVGQLFDWGQGKRIVAALSTALGAAPTST